LPGSSFSWLKVFSITTRREWAIRSAASIRRNRVCSLSDGSSVNHSTTAPGSGSKSYSALPSNSASITAAAITVLPAPVVAVSEKATARPLRASQVAGVGEVAQDVADRVLLVVLERVPHGYSRTALIVKLVR
jgi:hypothetical protein